MTTVEPLRTAAIRVGHEVLRDRLESLGISRSAFELSLASWKVDAIMMDGAVVGMLMRRGPELHVAVRKEARGKWLSRRLIRQVFAPVLREHGRWTGPVMPGNRAGEEFVGRIRAGFDCGRFDPVTASVMAGTSVVGGVVGADAARKAARTQADSANRAQDIAAGQFDLINRQQAPWRQAGETALGDIAGMKDFFTHQFSAGDLATSLAPNYEFVKQQGLGAINNAATARGGLFSGNTLKSIADYTTNYAQNSYQQAFQNFTANQSNIFNRLASIAGLGQQANTTTASAGTSLAGVMGQAAMAGGTAQAAGTVGTANAVAGGLQNAMSWYALPKILAMGGGAPGGGGLGGLDPSSGLPIG